MTDQERIDLLFHYYCTSIKAKHEAYDFLREHRSTLTKSECETLEEIMNRSRTEERTLENIAMILFNVDLWKMFIDGPIPEDCLLESDRRKVQGCEDAPIEPAKRSTPCQ